MTPIASGNIRRHESRWLGEPVVQHKGTYDQVAEAIPLFDRRAFALYTKPEAGNELPLVMGENPYYDEVLRLDESGRHNFRLVPDRIR